VPAANAIGPTMTLNVLPFKFATPNWGPVLSETAPIQLAGATVHEVNTVPGATGVLRVFEIGEHVIPVETGPAGTVNEGSVSVAAFAIESRAKKSGAPRNRRLCIGDMRSIPC